MFFENDGSIFKEVFWTKMNVAFAQLVTVLYCKWVSLSMLLESGVHNIW